MGKSVCGIVDKLGRNVTSKFGLNKAILDKEWRKCRLMLAYKLIERSGVLFVDPKSTLPVCRHMSVESRESQSTFHCVA
ncbi:MAG: hypothetical protein ACLPX5_09115 [Dissulfurispiraceae bacterium]